MNPFVRLVRPHVQKYFFGSLRWDEKALLSGFASGLSLRFVLFRDCADSDVSTQCGLNSWPVVLSALL